MNIFEHIKEKVAYIARQIFPDVDIPTFTVEMPKMNQRGDLSTNLAMVLTKALRRKPQDIANALLTGIKGIQYVQDAEVAGPGFINIKLDGKVWQEIVLNILDSPSDWGRLSIGNSEEVNIEFVSANPTGPMHVGHSRSAIYGDALANLLENCGYKVIREYYINDAGGQIINLSKSVFIRYQQLQGIDVELEEGCYPGEYIIEVAKLLFNKHGDSLLSSSEQERYEIISEFSVSAIMEMIKEDLRSLGVKHDIFISEKHDIRGLVEQSIEKLEEKGLIYHGVLTPPKGKTPEDWEPREQMLFKSTDFGDDIDRPLKKSDGSYTYFAADVAYHWHKVKRGYGQLILLLGVDHGGYVKRLQAAVSALSDKKVNLTIKLNQLVNLFQDGKPYKMSKRAGTFIGVANLLKEIDKDILRFVMLTRKNDSVLDLDFVAVKEQSKENPVFYVQYAHTRACSILRNAQESGFNYELDKKYLDLVKEEEYINLIKKIASFPKLIESAALHYEPHRISYYLYELSSDFHSLWNFGNEKPSLRFLQENNAELTKARLMVVKALATTIKSGLEILGVKALEEM